MSSCCEVGLELLLIWKLHFPRVVNLSGSFTFLNPLVTYEMSPRTSCLCTYRWGILRVRSMTITTNETYKYPSVRRKIPSHLPGQIKELDMRRFPVNEVHFEATHVFEGYQNCSETYFIKILRVLVTATPQNRTCDGLRTSCC